VALALTCAAAGPAGALEALRAELHAHTDISTGDFSLDALADLAGKRGIDVLLLSENYLVRIEYGLPPFRALTRVVHEERSVLSHGADRYLARVAATRRRFPRLVIVPGVEVIPHYYWTGSPVNFDLTLHDTQKNVLVFGISDPEKLNALPAIGSGGTRFSLASLVDVLPVVLLVPGVRFIIVKRQQRIRVGRAWVIVRRRRWIIGTVCCLIGALAVVRAFPFSAERYAYWQPLGVAPHQALIDQVREWGGVTVWSFPEARDAGQRFVGPVRVSWRTEPYADDLLRTFRYTAFGALYEDTTRFEQPGRGWDRMLGEYVAGERSQPAWAVAESGFHGYRAGKQVGAVQTVFLASERSEAGVLDAFKRGRMYGLLRLDGPQLALGDFSVTDGSAVAGLGETLSVPAGTPIMVQIGLDVQGGTTQRVRVNLVKNGTIVQGWASEAPGALTYRDTFDGTPSFYRVDVMAVGAPSRLLGNPVFVKTP
jgi:hypothetical protein